MHDLLFTIPFGSLVDFLPCMFYLPRKQFHEAVKDLLLDKNKIVRETVLNPWDLKAHITNSIYKKESHQKPFPVYYHNKENWNRSLRKTIEKKNIHTVRSLCTKLMSSGSWFHSKFSIPVFEIFWISFTFFWPIPGREETNSLGVEESHTLILSFMVSSFLVNASVMDKQQSAAAIARREGNSYPSLIILQIRSQKKDNLPHWWEIENWIWKFSGILSHNLRIGKFMREDKKNRMEKLT